MTEQISINAQSSIRIAGETVIYFLTHSVSQKIAMMQILSSSLMNILTTFRRRMFRKCGKQSTILVAPKSMDLQMLKVRDAQFDFAHYWRQQLSEIFQLKNEDSRHIIC